MLNLNLFIFFTLRIFVKLILRIKEFIIIIINYKISLKNLKLDNN